MYFYVKIWVDYAKDFQSPCDTGEQSTKVCGTSGVKVLKFQDSKQAPVPVEAYHGAQQTQQSSHVLPLRCLINTLN